MTWAFGGNLFGWECDGLYTLYQDKCGMIKRVIIQRRTLLKKTLQYVIKPYLVEDDSVVLIDSQDYPFLL